jgi:histidine triad (HIT) family protein
MNDCIFCKIIKGDIPSKKVYEDDNVIAIMDVSPKVNGHTLVIPKKHIDDLINMSDEDIINVNTVAKKLVTRLMNKLDAKGITCGVNYGESQAVKHYHMHLLPNYLLGEEEIINTDLIYEKIKED